MMLGAKVGGNHPRKAEGLQVELIDESSAFSHSLSLKPTSYPTPLRCGGASSRAAS